MIQSQNITTIAAALVKAQKNMGNAVKDSKNPFFKSSYADLNSVREACLPSLNAEGISVLQPTVYIDGKAFVQTMLLHSSGEFIGSLTEIISTKNNDPQAHGSGISYARRYGLQSLINLGAEDDDGEKAMGRTQAVSKPKTLLETVKEKEVVNHTAATPSNAEPKKTVAFKPKPKAAPAVEASEDLDL